MQKRSIQKLPARITVMGAARSGLAAARYLCDHGVHVFISDICPPDELQFKLASNNLAQVAHEAQEHTERVLESDAILLSPGIPSNLWPLQVARRRAIPIWSEIELGFRRSSAPFLAITGSSGKSTTTCMLGEIVKASGIDCAVCGNIGVPVIAVAPQVAPEGLVIAEVSSFQLETIDTFKPQVAAVLNFQKNHLDRYRGEEEYYEAKKQNARNMDGSCLLLLNSRDARLMRWAREIRPRVPVAFFGAPLAGEKSVWVEKTLLKSTWDGTPRTLLDVSAMKIRGRHNYDNAAAAAAMALAAGIDERAVAGGLCAFAGLPHRLQLAGSFGDVLWFNDSKSTTAESVRVAISAFPGNVHLIAGGRDKGCDFSVVRDVLVTHVKEAVLIGEAAARLESEWKEFVQVERAATLLEAIRQVGARAEPGDVVVFSPGCSSFDMFRDYEDRGEQFMALLREHGPRLGGPHG